ncbi:MAG: EAL domain-containing protein, partial [Selenomonadaceae bacterium]|nr:EAL domain-containing protein [Selenomonadaceae bacterium]
LFFQPQVDAMTQELIGAEALLRWQEEDGLVISPVVFIPILERTRLIIPVGRWIVDEAVRVCKKWQEFKPGFQMSINVSLCQLETTDLRNYVKESLERHALSPECLTLELTESHRFPTGSLSMSSSTISARWASRWPWMILGRGIPPLHCSSISTVTW